MIRTHSKHSLAYNFLVSGLRNKLASMSQHSALSTDTAIITFRDLLGAHVAVANLKYDDWNRKLHPSYDAKLIPSI